MLLHLWVPNVGNTNIHTHTYTHRQMNVPKQWEVAIRAANQNKTNNNNKLTRNTLYTAKAKWVLCAKMALQQKWFATKAATAAGNSEEKHNNNTQSTKNCKNKAVNSQRKMVNLQWIAAKQQRHSRNGSIFSLPTCHCRIVIGNFTIVALTSSSAGL